ncbi:nitroreductase family protein [Actinopolyspora sp. H202]|uniref:nitroreductase family protein n=1 Tax=Actinopolyspora sp. H202 TaxID=1500456 RepID=UPI003EE48CFB
MKPADSSVPLHPLLAERWSPRALDPEIELTDKQFTALFEAARWAPSWGNTQPARYIAGRRGESTFDKLHGTLSRGNHGWAGNASALVLGVVKLTNDDGEPLPYGEYGLGLATENLVLQAVSEGLVAHQMAGFDRDAAREAFGIPADYEPLVVVAVGAPGDAEQLPERLREKESSPRSRIPLTEFVFSDSWQEPTF